VASKSVHGLWRWGRNRWRRGGANALGLLSWRRGRKRRFRTRIGCDLRKIGGWARLRERAHRACYFCPEFRLFGR
jgi:hypothetical protein